MELFEDEIDWKDQLEDAESPEEIRTVLQSIGAAKYEVKSKYYDDIYVVGNFVIEWNGKDIYPNIEQADDWIYSVDPVYFIEDYDTRFNKEFWTNPYPLFHATSEEKAESIEKEGLVPKSETRGISNRSVGFAVFTTSSYDEAVTGTYGPVIFEIDTQAMKQDNYTPFVELEPNIAEINARQEIAEMLGIDFYAQYDSDMSPHTVIVNGPIPLKYIARN